VERIINKEQTKDNEINYNQTSIIMGINQWFAALFSAIACVPIAGSAGFIKTTKLVNRLPFIIGSVGLALSSFFPFITYFFAAIPAPVGYATVFISFSTMVGIGLKEYTAVSFTDENLFIIGFSFMIGIGSMLIPIHALVNLPQFLMTIANNGLVLGVITCMVLEQVSKYKHKDSKAAGSSI
jgi:xanthine/uracil permease